MNFIALESKQKLRGGFYTEQSIASFLVKWVKAINPQYILEPSCGDGAFLEAIEAQKLRRLKNVSVCELESDEAAKAQDRTRLPVEMLASDFLRWYLQKGQNSLRFDAVVGNPPFIRYQYLPKAQQKLAEKIFSMLHLRFTKHTNAWVPFIVASLQVLRQGGRIAMVIPSEIFHIPHAQSLRTFLSEQCSRILLLDPKELWFPDTRQGTVLLMAEKKTDPSSRSEGLAVLSDVDRNTLTTDPEALFQNATYTNGETIKGKWMPVFLNRKERNVLEACRNNSAVSKFQDVATVDVGIVTGANKFFLVPDQTVNEFDLSKWVHPMFGRSNHVAGLVFTHKDHEANKQNGLPSNFLWFRNHELKNMPRNVERYLSTGLDQKLHERFKCRTRKCWYEVPSVYVTPIAMLKRAHNFPRLVLNEAGAYTTDTAYRIRPTGMNSKALVLSFVNSLTCLTAELEGRHYGGGVLELVPSEIERLLVPRITTTISRLRKADKRFRTSNSDMEFLKEQDDIVLGEIGLSASERKTLYAAWLKLRNRRHRL